MSRYTVRDDDQYQVVVGWDPPLDSLFLQVFDATADDDRVVFDYPKNPLRRAHDLNELRWVTAEWAVLPAPVLTQLAMDMGA